MSREVVTLAKKTKGEYSYNEAIKTLRTNVQFCGSNLRRILLTSAFPDEGKSDVTFALASSLAQIGKKVILIDADIRKSVMVSRYQVETEINGLSQYLTGQREMEEVIYNTNFEGLSIIFAGPYSLILRNFWRKICSMNCLMHWMKNSIISSLILRRWLM